MNGRNPHCGEILASECSHQIPKKYKTGYKKESQRGCTRVQCTFLCVKTMANSLLCKYMMDIMTLGRIEHSKETENVTAPLQRSFHPLLKQF